LALPIAARTDSSLRAIPGMVSNVLPLRLTVRPSATLTELISLVSQEVRDLLARGGYRGEQLARDLGAPGGLRELVGPTVNVIGFARSLRFGTLEATVRHLWSGPINDLTVTVVEQPSAPVHRPGSRRRPVLGR